MTESHVHIDPQQASNGLAQWDAGAQSLQERWAEKVQAIQALSGPGTWGTDDPGTTFAGQHADSAEQFRTGGQAIVAQVTEVGKDSRTAIEASLASDAEQAGHVTVEVQGLP